MNKENEEVQNIEGNKVETKKLRTIKLSKDVNDYDTVYISKGFGREKNPSSSRLSSID